MKALLLQCTLLTTLCLASQCIAANPMDNSKYLPDKYFSLKRTKPSLSIANPLDVLRQRVILEMARRQREKAIQQADINREILKTIGKRGNSLDYNDIEEYLRSRYYDVARGYAPIYQPNHGSMVLNKVEPQQQQQIHSNSNAQNDKANVKVDNENKLTSNGNAITNEASQDPIYIFDDAGNSNNIEDDDETQVKYLYSLLKNRIPNSI
ncbi:uncharacterized protein Dh44 [Chironomus tepperi]|uniref:uncharacterized protein Dh44 n=1 Tax=Chironomus tepperi TaxID=113505 RepID=UPI00391EE436